MRKFVMWIGLITIMINLSSHLYAGKLLTTDEMKTIKGENCGTGYSCGYCFTSPNASDKCFDPKLPKYPEGTYCTTCSGEKGRTIWTDNPGCAKQWTEVCQGNEGNSSWDGSKWICYILGPTPCGSRHKCQDE